MANRKTDDICNLHVKIRSLRKIFDQHCNMLSDMQKPPFSQQ